MGGGGSAPKAYTPASQPQADSAYMGTLNNLTAADQANMGAVNSGYTNAYNQTANNPFNQSFIQGTVSAANAATGVGNSDIAAGQQAINAANQNYGYANTVAGYAPQFDNLAATAAGYATPLAADATQLESYAPELMELGLDPNFANYNYGLKQTQDTQNVQNAESGLAGSPFAAGLTGDASAAYTRNYNAQRLTNAIQALSALGTVYGNAGSLRGDALSALTGSGNLLNSGIGALNTASGIDTNAANLATAGSSLEGAGADTLATAAGMPYEAANSIPENEIAALNAMASGDATMSGSVNNDVTGYGNYLNIGQNATNLDQNAAKINYQDSFLGSLGQLIGVGAQIGAHFIPGFA